MDYIIRSADDKARLWRVIDGLAPKVWRVSITAYRSRRSNDQNRLAWKIYNAVAAETGYSPEEVHSLFKQKFGEPKTVSIGGVEITEYTTRDRDVAWFSDYLDRCQAFAASELGVSIGYLLWSRFCWGGNGLISPHLVSDSFRVLRVVHVG